MALVRIPHESKWSIRLGGEISLASAVELKSLLGDWLPSGKDLELDLQEVAQIDVPALQLLAAAGKDAARRGLRIGGRGSEAFLQTVRSAGFDQVPEFPLLDRA